MVKTKRGVCMADGGVVRKETADEIMARMTAKYGAPSAGPAQQPAPQPQAPAPVAKPPDKSANPLTSVPNMFERRRKQIDDASGYADGGVVGRVKFEGKGGPREDRIPVKVSGQNISVSDGEQALIIPAKTAANEKAMAAIQQIIAESNDGRQPDMGHGKYADGGLVDEEKKLANPLAGLTLGKSPASTIYGNGGLPAPVVQAGIDKMRSQLATPARNDTPTDPNPDPERMVIDGVRYGPTPKPMNPLTALGSGYGATINALAPSFDNRAAERLAANRSELNNEATVPPSVNPLAPKLPSPASVPSATPAGSEAKAAVPANGRDASGVITAESAQAAYGNQLSGKVGPNGQKTSVFGTMDMAGVNDIMARENAARQSMIDSQRTDTKPGGGVAILGDGGTEALNAERTNRWRQDDLIAKASRGNPAAAAAIQAEGQTQAARVRGQFDAQSDAGRQNVAMRGQDIAAQNEASRLAGNPLAQAVLGQQVEGMKSQNESTRMLADIQKKALAGDAQAMAVYKSLTNKTHQQNPLVVPGGEYSDPSDPLGQKKLKNPSAVYDPATGQWHTMPEPGKTTAKAQAPASAIDFLKKNPNQASAFKAKYGYLPEGF